MKLLTPLFSLLWVYARAKRLGRELTFRPREAHELLREGRVRQATVEWKELYAKRAGIEGTVSQSVRSLGLRVTRYRGMGKTRLRAVATATGLNVARVPRFARLMAKA